MWVRWRGVGVRVCRGGAGGGGVRGESRVARGNAQCGWSGGVYGVGKRISIKHTRALLNAALAGELDDGKVSYDTHPVFKLRIPTSCPDVPADILNPRDTWEDKDAYDAQADKLRKMFRDNYEAKGLGELGIPAVM